uniref:Uncharacterized protein n=1 Tax=Proteus mirabilis TaxID=584 RepID=L0AQB6_PROMI|nr:hypothetical protein [Proteus mirabilis]QDF46337.1 hypothetical protein [Proteus mirabilis]
MNIKKCVVALALSIGVPGPRPSLIRRAICTSENEDFALAIIKVQYAFSQHKGISGMRKIGSVSGNSHCAHVNAKPHRYSS